MARVQYGVIVTELKGKIAGQVFQGGNVGYVLRNKGYTSGISSPNRQSANRNMIAQTTSWRTLTDVQRASWNSGASTWPFVDKFGNTYTGSGFQVYTAFNSNLLSLGLPAVLTIPSAESPNNPGTVTAIMFDNGGIALEWENAGEAPDYILLFASPARSPGKNTNYVRYRKIAFENINGSVDFTTGSEYNSIWSPVVAGQTVVIKVTFANSNFPYYKFTQVISVVVQEL